MFLPPTSDQSRLAEFYSLADVFTICSKRENFPTTCIEAQCCGTEVEGFDTGGTRETSVTGTDNFVSYGDISELAQKTCTLLDSPISRQTVADISQKAYSKETMIKNYLNEYDRLGNKKRILLIDVNCKYSSTGKIVYDLYEGIRNDGREAAICYGRGPVVEGKDIYKFGLDWETKLHAGLARVTGYNGCFSPVSTKRLIDFIDDYKPDLIHIHELHAYFLNLKPLLTHIKDKGIPVVWTFHCEYMYTGKCGHAYNCQNFRTGCGHCPAVHDYPKSLIFDRTRQMFKMKKQLMDGLDVSIVTPSQWLADRVKLSYLKDRPIKVIHNGIDTSVFHPVDTHNLRARLDIPENNKVVLAVAPDIMSERKGGQWVLKLADQMKNEPVTFVLVGCTGILGGGYREGR